MIPDVTMHFHDYSVSLLLNHVVGMGHVASDCINDVIKLMHMLYHKWNV